MVAQHASQRRRCTNLTCPPVLLGAALLLSYIVFADAYRMRDSTGSGRHAAAKARHYAHEVTRRVNRQEEQTKEAGRRAEQKRWLREEQTKAAGRQEELTKWARLSTPKPTPPPPGLLFQAAAAAGAVMQLFFALTMILCLVLCGHRVLSHSPRPEVRRDGGDETKGDTVDEIADILEDIQEERNQQGIRCCCRFPHKLHNVMYIVLYV